MKKITIFLVILLVFTLVLAGCKTPLKEEPEDIRECIDDSDCIKIQTSCCSCERGGKEECISTAAKPLYESLLDSCSENVVCPLVDNCEIEKCICLDGKCTTQLKDTTK